MYNALTGTPKRMRQDLAGTAAKSSTSSGRAPGTPQENMNRFFGAAPGTPQYARTNADSEAPIMVEQGLSTEACENFTMTGKRCWHPLCYFCNPGEEQDIVAVDIDLGNPGVCSETCTGSLREQCQIYSNTDMQPQ